MSISDEGQQNAICTPNFPKIEQAIYQECLFSKKGCVCVCERERGGERVRVSERSVLPATMTLKLHTKISMCRICYFEGARSQFWNQIPKAEENNNIGQ